MKKLSSKKGETLVESLVAILVFTLSSVMLFTMITAATNLNRAAAEADQRYRDEMVYAEQAEDLVRDGDLSLAYGINGKGSVTFSLEESDVELCSYNVEIYRLNEESLYSYSME